MLFYKKGCYTFTEDLAKLERSGFLKVSKAEALEIMRKPGVNVLEDVFSSSFLPFLLDTLRREKGIAWDAKDCFVSLKVTEADTAVLIQVLVVNRDPDLLYSVKSSTRTKAAIKPVKHHKALEQFGSNLFAELISEEVSDEPMEIDLMTVKDGRSDKHMAKEVNMLIETLSRKTRNSPLVVGERGVGKTTLIHEFAKRVMCGDVPSWLENCVIWQIDSSRLVAGTQYRGMFEERMLSCINDAMTDKDVILFFDNIHTLVGAGSTSDSRVGSASDAGSIIAPYISSGKIKVIGTTTPEAYQQVFDTSEDFKRGFQIINLKEPDIATTCKIMQSVASEFADFYGINISKAEQKLAVELAKRYKSDKFLPDSAIDLLDEACAKQRCKSDGAQNLQRNSLYLVIAEQLGIPVQKISESDTKRLLNLEKALEGRVKGQADALKSVANAIRCSRVGMQDATKPMASFLFAGSTGVGKTELCKALAYELFSDDTAMTRIDMSEYQNEESVNNLIGSPKGYVGYSEGGVLTSAVNKRPYSIILLDEIEKAHPKVLDLLLQVLDDGRLTDNRGKTVDFRNTVVIMTTNLGAKKRGESRAVGFNSNTEENRVESFKEAIQAALRPEFINRIDEIVVFNKLSSEVIREIALNMLSDVKKNAVNCGMTVNFDESVLNWVSENGYNEEYGARPLKRFIEKEVSMKISNWILDGTMKKKNNYLLTYNEDKGLVCNIAEYNRKLKHEMPDDILESILT